jgi:hypothetical protein
VAEQAVELPVRSRAISLGSPVAQICLWWLAARALVFVCAALLHWQRWPHGYFKPEFSSTLNVLAAWDGRWYEQVARNGYLLIPGHQSDPAFFPLYSILLRIAHEAGLSYAAAGVVISNLILPIGLWGFYKLGRELLPESDARRASIFVAIAPMGFTFSMVYPESLVFASMAFAGYFALRGRWLWAALFGAAAALARPQGALIVFPLLGAAWHAWPVLSARARGLALGAVLAPLLALASFPLYLGEVLGDAHAWSRAQQAWGRSFHIGGFVDAFRQLPARNGIDHWILRDALFCLAYILLLALAKRAGIPWGWIVAGALMVLLPLETGSFISVARFGLLSLPVFWGLGVLGRNRTVDWTLRLVCVGLLVGLTLTLPLTFP